MRSKQKKKSAATEKLIVDYQNKISEYLKRNTEIENEIMDLKNSIGINQDIIYSLIPNDPKIKDALEIASKIYLSLLDKKSTIESNLGKYEQYIQNIPMEIEMLKTENLQIRKELEVKIGKIEKLKADGAKERKNALFKTPREEVFIVSPTQETLDMYNKMSSKSSCITGTKKSNIQSKEKKDGEILEFTIKSIEKELERIQREERDGMVEIEKGVNANDAVVPSKKLSLGELCWDDNKYSDSDQNYDDEENEETEKEKPKLFLEDREELEHENNILQLDNESGSQEQIVEGIEKSKKELEDYEQVNASYKKQISECKTTYHKLRDEIHRLTKIIKKNSAAPRENSTTKKKNSD